MRKERKMEFPEVVITDLAEALYLLTRKPRNTLIKVEIVEGEGISERFRMTFTGMCASGQHAQFFANDVECTKVDFSFLPLLFAELSKHTATLNPSAWMETCKLAEKR